MCFAPQRRALFRHVYLQKWSENGVLCTFWLQNVLRATTACTFSTSQLPNVVWKWCALYILTWKRASPHNGVHFFDITTSKSGPNPAVFNTFEFKMCFAPQRRANFHLRLFYLFAHLHLLSFDSFSSLIFFLLLFSSLTLATSAFPSVHIVGSLTCKLPSRIYLKAGIDTQGVFVGHRPPWTPVAPCNALYK